MKISKAITEVLNEIKKAQLDLDSRDTNDLKTMESLGKKEGLKKALEIIKSNM